MENSELIFWVIAILFFIIFPVAKKKAPEKKEDSGEEKQALEQLLEIFSDGEQPKPVTPTPVEAKVSCPPELTPPPQPPSPLQPRRQPVVISEDIIAGEEKKLFEREMGFNLIRQGIVLSEVLGPPRAEKPF